MEVMSQILVIVGNILSLARDGVFSLCACPPTVLVLLVGLGYL